MIIPKPSSRKQMTLKPIYYIFKKIPTHDIVLLNKNTPEIPRDKLASQREIFTHSQEVF